MPRNTVVNVVFTRVIVLLLVRLVESFGPKIGLKTPGLKCTKHTLANSSSYSHHHPPI